MLDTELSPSLPTHYDNNPVAGTRYIPLRLRDIPQEPRPLPAELPFDPMTPKLFYQAYIMLRMLSHQKFCVIKPACFLFYVTVTLS